MGKHKSLERHYNKWGYIFILPFVLAFLIFHLWPMISTFYYAFCDLKRVSVITEPPKLLTSNGLPWYKNFQDLFATSSFKISIKNTFVFMICQIIPEWILAFWLAATMTDRRLKVKGRSMFRTSFFFPKLVFGSSMGYRVFFSITGYVASSVAFALTAAAIDGFGVTEKDFEFFLSNRFLIAAVSVFMHFGITFIYAVAGMTSIPVEVFEAAEMDGSSRLHTFFHVTLPSIRPILFFIVVVSVVDGLNMSDIPAMLSDRYDVSRTGLTMMNFLENMLSMGQVWDRASAFSLVLFALSVIISGFIYFFLIRDRYEAKLARLRRKEKREERRLARAAKAMTA